jgi:hypothetical protein
MSNQIEILKVGSIMTTKQANGLRRLNIVCDGGHILDYYRQIVIGNTAHLFEFYDTQQIFVGGPFPYNNPNRLVGHIDEIPLVGQPFTMNKRSWHSSRIEYIIDNCIIITKNSVYALHDISKLREIKLQNIGI